MPESRIAMPMPAPVSPRLRCAAREADGQRRAVVLSLDRTVVVNAEDLGIPLELRDRAVRQVEHLAVDDAEPALDAREALERCRQFRIRRERHDHAGHFLGPAAFPAGHFVVRLVILAVGTGRGVAGRDCRRRGPDEQHEWNG